MLAGTSAAPRLWVLANSIPLFWSAGPARYGFIVATTPSAASFAVIERT